MSIHKQTCNAACHATLHANSRVRHHEGMHDRTPAMGTASARESSEYAPTHSSPSHKHRTCTRTPQPQPQHRHQKLPATAGHRHQNPPATAMTQATAPGKTRDINQFMYIESKNPTTQALFGEKPIIRSSRNVGKVSISIIEGFKYSKGFVGHHILAFIFLETSDPSRVSLLAHPRFPIHYVGLLVNNFSAVCWQSH